MGLLDERYDTLWSVLILIICKNSLFISAYCQYQTSSDIAMVHLARSSLQQRRDLHVFKLVNNVLKTLVPTFLITLLLIMTLCQEPLDRVICYTCPRLELN